MMYESYNKAYLKAVKEITRLYEENKSDEELLLRHLLFSEYRKSNLDPDGNAIRYVEDIKCTADGLLSIWRICNMEPLVEDIIPTYSYYRSKPIFFFPCENGGINTSRASVFGDRIDHTLFDLKMYYSKERDNCRLINAYNRPKTNAWLQKMKSFENIVEWWGVIGIFTDNDYNVYDLECNNNQIITSLKETKEYQNQWSFEYYNHIKECIQLFMKNRETESDI